MPSVGFYRTDALDAPMRAVLAVLAVAATVSLSGCMWWADEMRGGGASDGDAEFPLAILGILVLVGIVLVVVNLSQQDSQPPPPPGPPMAPHAPSAPAPLVVPGGWMEVEDVEEPAPAPSSGKRRSTSKRPAKQARRRAP